MQTQHTTVFISHGGGPLPLLGDPGHQQMVSYLQALAKSIPRPAAILVISAHWEAPVATVTTAADPGLLYDYYGFPEPSYEIQYPCPGEPALAAQLVACLGNAGISAAASDQRALDHGVFVPLKIMYPEAGIPCVQLSLLESLDPEAHIRLGEALRSLVYNNLLIVGSGFSFHNLKAFYESDRATLLANNARFEKWLTDTCCNTQLSETERRQRLVNWKEAPAALYSHPREEHLLPLHVCYGVTQRPCSKPTLLDIMGVPTSMFAW